MNRSILLFLAIAVPSISLAQLPEGWKWQNPLPHGLTIHDVEMLDISYAIAGCENGYIMRTFDGGSTWSQTRIAGGTIYDICSTPSKKVWAASADGAILFSSDLGMTWETQLAPQQNASGTAEIHMFNDDVGMAAIPRDKVYRTVNGGATWEEISDPYFGQDYARWLTAKSATTWYIMGTVGSTPRLYRTTNFGDSWFSDTEFDTRGLNKLTFIDSTYGFQCRNGELLRTTNSGASWDEMDIFGFGNVTEVVAGEQMADRLFALSEGSVVVNASYDGGTSWNISLLENAFGYASPTAIDFASPWIGIIVGSGGRILRTHDGGQSWNIVHGIGFLGHIIDVAFTNQLNGIALTATPTVLLTSNGGERWIETNPIPDVTLQKVSMYSETNGFAYGSDGTDIYSMYHTSDIGRTWERRGKMYEVMTDERYLIPQAMHADSDSRVFVGLSYGRFFRSTDGGVTFDSLALPPDLAYQFYTAMQVQTFDPNYVTVVASNGVIQSSDGGETWEFFRVSSSQWISAAMFTSPTRGYAIQGGHFSVTTNGGQTWQVSDNDDNELVHFFNDTEGVMHCTRYQGDQYTSSVKWTTNGGENWAEYTLRERVGWDEWFWLTPEQGWAYGYGGMIRHTGSAGVVGTEHIPEIVSSLTLHNVYPNPLSLSAHAGLSVEFSIDEHASGTVSGTIHDLLGRTLATFADDGYLRGRNVISIPASTLAKYSAQGPVFITLTAGSQRITRKIAIIR